MKTNILCLLGLAALVCSCVPSVNPFYTPADVITDARLVGAWSEKGDGPVAWSFQATATNSYTVTIVDGKNCAAGEFDGHLFKLGQENFLDITPTEHSYLTSNQCSIVKCSLIPGHLVLRVSQFEPTLHLAFCDGDWVKTYLQDHPTEIAHSAGKESPVFTADTADLQKFVLAHLGKGELFSDGMDLHRLPK